MCSMPVFDLLEGSHTQLHSCDPSSSNLMHTYCCEEKTTGWLFLRGVDLRSYGQSPLDQAKTCERNRALIVPNPLALLEQQN